LRNEPELKRRDRKKITKVLEHYQRFIFFLKDADLGIAKVKDTKKRPAGLNGQ
jgi:hypothetical protein